MSREHLPLRRAAESFEFVHGAPGKQGTAYKATVGLYEDGRIGEVFLSAEKLTTDADIAARDAAILLSYALQHGALISDIQKSMARDEQGRPLGVMGALLDHLEPYDGGSNG